jgi:hypothetical protein
MVIGDPRPKRDAKSTPSHKVVMEKLPDGEETITITIRGSTMGSHASKAEDQLWLVMTEGGGQPLLI